MTARLKRPSALARRRDFLPTSNLVHPRILKTELLLLPASRERSTRLTGSRRPPAHQAFLTASTTRTISGLQTHYNHTNNLQPHDTSPSTSSSPRPTCSAPPAHSQTAANLHPTSSPSPS